MVGELIQTNDPFNNNQTDSQYLVGERMTIDYIKL